MLVDAVSCHAEAFVPPRRATRAALLTALLASATPAWGWQATPQIPTREEIQRPAPATPAAAPGQILTADDDIERAPCPLANLEFATIRLTLSDVQFTAPAGIDTAMLDAAWEERVGQEVPLATVCDIRDRAATLLRREGYLAAARVPVQTIENGVVRLDILAAQMKRIEVRGDAGANEPLLQRYLSKIQDDPVFNIARAERYLLLAREIPGLDARLALRPSGAAGEVVGEVTVARTPVLFDFNVQNFGSRDVGRIGGIARVRLNGLTGLGDQTTASFYATSDFKEQRVVQIGHEMRLGGEGFRLGGNFTYAWTRPDIAALPIRSETLIGTLFASYPLVLRQSHRLTLTGGLDIIDQDIDLAGVPVNADRLRVATLRADAAWTDPASIAGKSGYSAAEPRWSLAATLEARQGLAMLGASKDCGPAGARCLAPGAVPLTRIEGDPAATVLRANAAFEWRPVRSVALAVQPRAQWTRDALLAFEEFSAGNFTVGRGYDPGTIIGDSGVAVASELRLGSAIPANKQDVALQPFAFFDAAWVWNEDSSFVGLNPQKLFSVGGGLRVAIGETLRLDLTAAVPLKRAGFQAQRGDARFLFSLTTQFAARAR